MKKITGLALLLVSQLSSAALNDDIHLRGQWTQGGMVLGVAPAGSQVELNGEPIMVSESGNFVVGFGRDEKGPATLHVSHQGESWQQSFPISQRDYKIQDIHGISKKIMQPNPANVKRSKAEAAQVYTARQTKREGLDFLLGFKWPAKGPITGVYGSQRIYNDVPGRPHFGLDIAGPVGTPIYAPAAGVVTLTHDDMFYSGGTLIIDHGMGISSTMIHLSKILVKEGQQVKTGDLIAEMGKSGRATGPHLDWRINWFNVRLDPQLVVSE